jgi:hypothetical protein
MSKRFVYYGGFASAELGLILHYDAGNDTSYPEPKTGTTVFDLTTPQENGTLENGVGYDVANGGSFVFDGVNDSIDYGGINLGTTHTISMWLNLSNLSSRIWLKGVAPSNENYYINPLFGNCYTQMNGSSAKFVATGFSAFVWFNVTMVRAGTSIDVYKNGILMGNMSDPLWTTDFILTGNNAAFNPFGKNTTTKIWSNEQTSTQILTEFNAEKARYGL